MLMYSIIYYQDISTKKFKLLYGSKNLYLQLHGRHAVMIQVSRLKTLIRKVLLV